MMMNQVSQRRSLNEQGTAVVSAVLVVALVTILAVGIQFALRLQILRLDHFLTAEVLLNAALSGESVALAKLSQRTLTPVALGQLIVDQQPEVTIETRIEDQEGLFNLNYLYDKTFCEGGEVSPMTRLMHAFFEQMLLSLPLKSTMTAAEAKNITQGIARWFCKAPSTTDRAAIGNEENQENQGNEKNEDPAWAYRPAEQLMISVSELRLVPGISEEVYGSLLPWITAWSEHQIGFGIELSEPMVPRFKVASMPAGLLAALLGLDPPAVEPWIDSYQQLQNTEGIKRSIIETVKQRYTVFIKPSGRVSVDNLFQKGIGVFFKMIANSRKNIENPPVLRVSTLVEIKGRPRIVWRSIDGG
jgi:type II secretory pathway component PulK